MFPHPQSPPNTVSFPEAQVHQDFQTSLPQWLLSLRGSSKMGNGPRRNEWVRKDLELKSLGIREASVPEKSQGLRALMSALDIKINNTQWERRNWRRKRDRLSSSSSVLTPAVSRQRRVSPTSSPRWARHEASCAVLLWDCGSNWHDLYTFCRRPQLKIPKGREVTAMPPIQTDLVWASYPQS